MFQNLDENDTQISMSMLSAISGDLNAGGPDKENMAALSSFDGS
jgi:hypothetical protein